MKAKEENTTKTLIVDRFIHTTLYFQVDEFISIQFSLSLSLFIVACISSVGGIFMDLSSTTSGKSFRYHNIPNQMDFF